MPIQFAVALLVISRGVPDLISAQTAPRPRDAIASLIAQLGAANYRVREQAGRALIKIGGPALPALNRAARTSPLLETKRRIEIIVARIEYELLAVEAKNWQKLDAPYYVKDRLVQVMTRKPALSDDQCVAAVYLITVNRRPTRKEMAQALARFARANCRTIAALEIARPLIQSKEANADLIYSYLQVVKEAETPGAFGGSGRSYLSDALWQFSAALQKAARTNDVLVDLAYLFILSRFPQPNEAVPPEASAPDGRPAEPALRLIQALRQKAESMRVQ